MVLFSSLKKKKKQQQSGDKEKSHLSCKEYVNKAKLYYLLVMNFI